VPWHDTVFFSLSFVHYARLTPTCLARRHTTTSSKRKGLVWPGLDWPLQESDLPRLSYDDFFHLRYPTSLRAHTLPDLPACRKPGRRAQTIIVGTYCPPCGPRDSTLQPVPSYSQRAHVYCTVRMYIQYSRREASTRRWAPARMWTCVCMRNIFPELPKLDAA
jgi:hypothetical protein